MVRNGLLLLAAGAAFCAEIDPAAGPSVLEKRCVACHSGKFKKSGLDVTSRELLLKGGDRGPAIVPGDAKSSLLYQSIVHGKQPHMPFQMAKLADAEAAAVAAWIDKGAEFPGNLRASENKHWAFELPKRPAVPVTKNGGWVRNPLDAFVAAVHEKKGLTPLGEADPRTLGRRVYLDLVGVPPTPAEMSAFLTDKSPEAYEKLVNRLLDDPRYGERWGRHWMDVWRYADWYGWRKGKDWRNSARHIWRWRDWIVESLNRDKGYDRMVLEMIAGDEIAPGDPDVVRATGYLARSYSKYDRHGWLQDAVDHTAMAFLGVTLKCARCHDHKYDPISQDEYFKFRAFFEPYHVRLDRVPGEVDVNKNGLARVFDENPNAETFKLIRGDVQNPDKTRAMEPAVPAAFGGPSLDIAPVGLPIESYYPDHRGFVHTDLVAAAKADIEKAEKALREAKPEENAAAEKALTAAKAALPALEARIAADVAKHSNAPDAEALAEKARKAERVAGIAKAAENLLRAQMEFDAALAKPGEADEKKLTAARNQIEAAKTALTREAEGYTPVGKTYSEKSSGRRLALARWIASKQNPLTARVAVNHVWLRHFGRALTPTVFDFGKNGKAPSNPELLDWLATEFMASGWSMKSLHRTILTSNAYRMKSSAGTEDHPNARIDPENTALWRMNPRRMEAEVVRDSILAVAGKLDPAVGGPEIDAEKADDVARRSIYLQHVPDLPVQFLKVFDSASTAECYEREASVVPHQALAMSNSKLSREQAKRLAANLDGASFVESAFQTILARPPSPEERQHAEKFLRGDPSGGAQARESLAHVLLNHNDFVTIR